MPNNIKPPDQILTSSPTSTPPQMPLWIPDPSIKGVSFDQLLNNRGLRFLHRRALPCPNMTSLEDVNHDPHCPVCDGDQMIYYQEKIVKGVFVSNSLEKNLENQGLWEEGTAVVTVKAEYEDGTEAEFVGWDVLRILDYTVRLWELKEYVPRSDNLFKLRYPIIQIDFVGSVINGVLHEYIKDVDFVIVSEGIRWLPGKAPYYNPATKHGQVLTISYYTNPDYTVVQHLRELRITQEMINGQKQAIRLPQQLLVKRSFLRNPSNTKA